MILRIYKFKFIAQYLRLQKENKMSRERVSRRFYRMDSSNDLLEFMDRGYSAQHENRWYFEVAWEAANKGININIYIT